MKSLLNCGLLETLAQSTWPCVPGSSAEGSHYFSLTFCSGTIEHSHTSTQSCGKVPCCWTLCEFKQSTPQTRGQYGFSSTFTESFSSKLQRNVCKKCFIFTSHCPQICCVRGAVMREKDAQIFSLFLLVVDKDVKEKNIQVELFYFLKKENCRGAVIRCWRSCSWCLLVVFHDQRPLFNVGLAGLTDLKMLLIGKTSASNGTWLKCPSAWQTSIVVLLLFNEENK